MRRSKVVVGRGRRGVRMGLAMSLLVALGLAASVHVAHALSEWWTPSGASCPTFDSENACESYCQSNQQLCGGSTQCSWKTGTQRPMC